MSTARLTTSLGTYATPRSGNGLAISPRVQKWMAWSGPALAIMMLIGMSLAHMIPWGAQPSPSLTADETAAFYREHLTAIRVGCVLCILSQALYVPFGTLIALHTWRIERGLPIFSILQIVAVAACTAIAAPFAVFWALAAFRAGDAGASAETIRMFHDAGWMFFMIPLPVFTLWFLLIALAVGSKHNDESVFPRWIAYVNWVEVFGLLPVFLVMFFKTGAFSWAGAVGLYLPLALFCAWFIVMSVSLLKAAGRAQPLIDDEIPTSKELELDQAFEPVGAAGD